jgi:hypothetical protein
MENNKNSIREKIILFIGMLLASVGVIGGLDIALRFFGLPMIWGSFFEPIIGNQLTGFDLFNSIIFTPTMILAAWGCFYCLFISPKHKR